MNPLTAGLGRGAPVEWCTEAVGAEEAEEADWVTTI